LVLVRLKTQLALIQCFLPSPQMVEATAQGSLLRLAQVDQVVVEVF
jgi:hypothetical protein